MSDTRDDFDDIDITQAEGPDIETDDDLQTQLGTPDRESDAGASGLTATEAAAAREDDSARGN